MKPTDFLLTGNLKGMSKPEALKLLYQMEEQGCELLQRGTVPSWMKQAEFYYRETSVLGRIAHADGNDVVSDPLYRLIPHQEQSND